MQTPDHFARGHDGQSFDVDGRIGPDEFDDLLLWCSDRKASDITIQSFAPVIAEIGGDLVKITSRALTHPEVEELVRYIYGENGPGEIKSGFDLDPSHEVKIAGRGRMRFRVNITGGRIPGGDGIQITVRTLPEVPIPIDQLGVEPEIIENFRPSSGMILVTGTTGSGKSTLLSSGIRMLVERPDANEKVLEYSKPVEFVYDKVEMPSSMVFQTEVGRHLRPRGLDRHGDEGSEFAHCVRNALRRKPTIIMIGESRDKATTSASIEAALTGHLLYTTMHTMGVAETLRRSVTFYPGDEKRSVAVDLLETLRMVVTQTLLPRVGGGKVACREFLIFDDQVRAALQKADVDDWSVAIREILSGGKNIGRSMLASAQRLREQNMISEQTFSYLARRAAT